MALMETHYYSHALGSNITLNVFVPTPGSAEAITDVNHTVKYDYDAGLPVVYLLHGAFGDAFSWVRYSNIDRYAQDRGVVVVMASAENSFYHDMVHGKAYKTFFTEELPTFIQGVFPVSRDRDKTFIGGFSMGGYGAWYLGLSRPDLYAKAFSLSGVLDVATQVRATQSDPTYGSVMNMEDVFADPYHLEGTDSDLFALYDKAVAAGTVPQLYQACGTEDFLYGLNQSFKARLEAKGADFVYEEGPGGHEWNFWDTFVQRALDWMLAK